MQSYYTGVSVTGLRIPDIRTHPRPDSEARGCLDNRTEKSG